MAINELEGRYQCERPVRVVKRADVEKRNDYMRQHQIAMLSLLAELHPEKILELAEKIRLQKLAA